MSDDGGEDAFGKATSYVASLAATGDPVLSDGDLLKFYSLFKQASEGPCTQGKPAFYDVKGRAKWAAWSALGELPRDEAAAQYVERLSSLRPGWLERPTAERSGVGGPVFSSFACDMDEGSAQLDDAPPLVAAASTGALQRVLQLLEGSAAQLDERDSEGCSALHWAADKGHVEVAQALVAAGADVHAVDGDGLTPLHYAALAEQREVAVVLITEGGALLVQKRSAEGETAEEVAPKEWRVLFAQQ